MLEKLPEALGHALRDRRAGLDKLVFNTCGMRSGLGMLKVTSLAFADHAPIPERYTADGEGLSPPIDWTGVPESAHSLVLIVEDADAPTSDPLVHAIVVDIPPQDASMHEGALKSPGHAGEDDLHAGRNSYFMAGWIPPDPPRGHGQHRYAFQLFALAEGRRFSGKPTRGEVLKAIQERGIAGGMLVGTYTRPDGSIEAGQGAPAVRSRIAN
ncbi:YbhB/YbcL family Raf kinase inhibitor-like protein [Ramlibacter henchirensis]|uniref:YbhB/YbcL family Raf kinase inhibitor-like protein n=1 Tax=Ramlibacter henchirensis TaxID=204072 RepID=A0A4Z0BSA6_9BURK|nr:YbhB/YbcL family Raf kinase inhibitor-like protein [Ramlibacter henchirensis]TFZ02177.1 YbhB/YbcL family Raf kinase inhibitor-like protein [Ramlibacter henchirensis]